MRTRIGLAVMIAGGLLLAPAAGRSAEPAQGHAMSSKDFITHAAMGGLAEVRLGQLAEEKGATDEVKQFGRRMVDDHTKANQELARVAEQEHVPMPTKLDAKNQALYDRLAKLSGPAFDRAYMDQMLKDHRTDVAEFEKASQSSDPNVQAFASKTLPTLKDHLSNAEQVASRAGSKSGETAGRGRRERSSF